MAEDNSASLQTLLRQLGRRGFGTTGWTATMREILRFYVDPNLRNTVSADLLGQIENTVAAAFERDVEAIRPLMEEAGFPLTEDVETWQQAYGELLGAVEAALGGSSDVISSIRETVNTLIAEETQQTRIETTGITGTEEETIVRQETRFVELPTADQVLDDFDRVIIEQMDTLWRAGDINRTTRDFFVQNPGFLWSDYIAEQTRRIREGEDPFRVVGVEGPQVKLGTRPGEAVQQEITTLLNQVRTGELTIEDVVERTIDRLTEQAGTQGEGIVDTDLQQSITEAVTSLFNQFSTETLDSEKVSTLTLLTVEEIIARPELSKVFAFSPSDFLTERFTPTELMNIAAAVPGQQAAARQQPFGVAPSAPRRLA